MLQRKTLILQCENISINLFKRNGESSMILPFPWSEEVITRRGLVKDGILGNH